MPDQLSDVLGLHQTFKLIFEREQLLLKPTKELARQMETVLENQQLILSQLGELMSTVNQHGAVLGERLDQINATNQKSFAEIRAALDAALESQITPAELQAAVEAAKAETRNTVQAENDAAIDGAFAELLAKAETAQASAKALDDIVPDAPTEPEQPVE